MNGKVIDLGMLKPVEEKVVVDDLELVLRTGSVIQQKRLAELARELDVAPLFEIGAPILDAVLGGNVEGRNVAAVIAVRVPMLLREIIDYIAGPASAAMSDGVAVMLDNYKNFKTLVAAGLVDPTDAEMDGTRYIRSEALQRAIANTVTAPQAVYILKRAIEVYGYDRLGKEAVGMVKGMLAKVTAKAEKMAPPAPTTVEMS